MKPLETHFVKKGWTHEQLMREGMIALYKRWKDGAPAPHWEVIRIQEHAERTFPGSDTPIPAKEGYPGEGLWGQEGWTFLRLDTAEKRFQDLVSKEPARIAAREARATGVSCSPVS